MGGVGGGGGKDRVAELRKTRSLELRQKNGGRCRTNKEQRTLK